MRLRGGRAASLFLSGSLYEPNGLLAGNHRPCVTPKYREPPDFEPTALASSPGSGNTWLRYLIQQATGKKKGEKRKSANAGRLIRFNCVPKFPIYQFPSL